MTDEPTLRQAAVDVVAASAIDEPHLLRQAIIRLAHVLYPDGPTERERLVSPQRPTGCTCDPDADGTMDYHCPAHGDDAGAQELSRKTYDEMAPPDPKRSAYHHVPYGRDV
jgi:hypothetical protein